MSEVIRDRWRSRKHFGEAKPVQCVEVRRGLFHRDYRAWPGREVAARIPGESRARPWFARWEPRTDWREIPNVASVELNQNLKDNGLQVASITAANIVYERHTSSYLSAVYHLIRPGWLSPLRSYVSPQRPDKGLDPNFWFDYLDRMAQVRVWQGYGEPDRDEDGEIVGDGGDNGAFVFSGHIDDIDMDSDPRTLQITAREGVLLTDERAFGWAKSRQLRDPIVFADRRAVDNTTRVGKLNGFSSQYAPKHPASAAMDDDEHSSWWCDPNDADPWLEIEVPAGRYEDIRLNASWSHTCLVSIYLTDQENGRAPRVDGKVKPTGWLDLGAGDTAQGVPYIRRIGQLDTVGNTYDLRHRIYTGDGTRIRVTFPARPHITQRGNEIFGMRTFRAYRRVRRVNDTTKKWILCDDVADMVKVVLRWAGFEEWEVEDTGTRITGHFAVNRSTFLFEIIKAALDQLGDYVFFVGDGHEKRDGNSLGVPVLRRNTTLDVPDGIEEVTDKDLTTAVSAKISFASMPFIIRIRGRADPQGLMLGADRMKRVSAAYQPPWSRRNRMSGVMKHVTHTNPKFRTDAECMTAAKLMAYQAALLSSTARFTVPGMPCFQLDDQVGVSDGGTGLNTRVWIAERSSTFQRGKVTTWTMTLGGSLIDSINVQGMIAELRDLNRKFDDHGYPIGGLSAGDEILSAMDEV